MLLDRMEDQGTKRKADAVLPKMEDQSTQKARRFYKQESPEIIVIEDDGAPSAQPQEGAHLTGRHKPGRDAQLERTHDKERMKDIGNIVGNLRDQVADWTLRVQQSETFFETLRVKIEDPPGTAWQEDMRKITSEAIRPLIERIKRLENSGVNYHQAKVQHPSTHDASKTAFKSPFTQSDDDSTDQSTVNKNLQERGSITFEDQACDKKGIAAQDKNSSNEKAVQLDILSGLGISSIEAFWKPATLSNKGLKELLQSVDFRNMEHLRALSTLDDCTTPRDCVLFCDTHFYRGIQQDYILRTGTTATYIRDPSGVRRDQEMELYHHGWGGLRIHQLDTRYLPNDPKGKDKFTAWMKEKAPPQYVYDIGQLFMRRRIGDRYELNGTQFNIVIDIAKPQKPVWLVMRPEYDPTIRIKSDTSNTPFPRLLNGVGIAKIADSFGELSFCRDPFDEASFVHYASAELLVSNTLFKGMLARRFSTPNIGEMEAKVTAGWGGTGPR